MTNLGKTLDILQKPITLGSLCVFRQRNGLETGIIVDIKTHVGIISLTSHLVHANSLKYPTWIAAEDVCQVNDEQVFETMSGEVLYQLANTRSGIAEKVEKNRQKHERAQAREAKKLQRKLASEEKLVDNSPF